MKNLRNSVLAVALATGTLMTGSAFAATDSADKTAAQPTTTETVEVVEVQTTTGHADPALVRLANQLDLTKDQRKSIEDVVSKARPGLEKITAELAGNSQALRSVMNQGKFDQKQVTTLAEKQGKNVTQLILAQAKLQEQVLAVLTAKQKQELKAILSGTAPAAK